MEYKNYGIDYIPPKESDQKYYERNLSEEGKESDIKETKQIKLMDESREIEIDHLQKHVYDGPDFPVRQTKKESIYSNFIPNNSKNAKKIVIEREMMEEWQLLTDKERNQIKARLFLKKNKLYEDSQVKIGIKIDQEQNSKEFIANDLYSKKDMLMPDSKWKKFDHIKIWIFWESSDKSNSKLQTELELKNESLSFTPVKSLENDLIHKSNNLNEITNEYQLKVLIRNAKKSEFSPSFYQKKINFEIPVSKLLIPVTIHSQKNFVRQMNKLDLKLETGTFSTDEEFFPSKQEFIHVFKQIEQMEQSVYGNFYKLVGMDPIFFLKFDFSEDFLLFKITARYDCMSLEPKLRLIIKKLIMNLSDFYV